MVDGKRLDLDRVLNLEELRAYFSTIAKYLRAKELDAIESVLGEKDQESKDKVARPLGRLQVPHYQLESSICDIAAVCIRLMLVCQSVAASLLQSASLLSAAILYESLTAALQRLQWWA